MSVEKPIRTKVERAPFTMVYNKVINEIENMEAFTIWVYLLSKSQDWHVIKEHLKNRFKIGDAKLKKILAYLNAHNLIEYRRERMEDGTLGEIEIWILDGSKWTLNPMKNKVVTTGSKTTRVENQSYGSGALLKKDCLQKKEKQQQGVVFLNDEKQKDEWHEAEQVGEDELIENEETKAVDDFMNKMFRIESINNLNNGDINYNERT